MAADEDDAEGTSSSSPAVVVSLYFLSALSELMQTAALATVVGLAVGPLVVGDGDVMTSSSQHAPWRPTGHTHAASPEAVVMHWPLTHGDMVHASNTEQLGSIDTGCDRGHSHVYECTPSVQLPPLAHGAPSQSLTITQTRSEVDVGGIDSTRSRVPSGSQSTVMLAHVRSVVVVASADMYSIKKSHVVRLVHTLLVVVVAADDMYSNEKSHVVRLAQTRSVVAVARDDMN